jgi:membrane-associated protease RseP (regulator of RpoE activity)
MTGPPNQAMQRTAGRFDAWFPMKLHRQPTAKLVLAAVADLVDSLARLVQPLALRSISLCSRRFDSRKIMKVVAYVIVLTVAHAAIAQSTGRGFVGLTISTTDYGLVTDIAPDTPAANSPIHVGDRIVSFGPIPVSHIRS